MNLPVKTYTDDPAWESVLEALSQGGHLSRFYRIPRHELAAVMKLYSAKAVRDLSRLFSLTQTGDYAGRQSILESCSEHLRYAMLYLIVRSMKCWVETESFNVNGRTAWKVANS